MSRIETKQKLSERINKALVILRGIPKNPETDSHIDGLERCRRFTLPSASMSRYDKATVEYYLDSKGIQRLVDIYS